MTEPRTGHPLQRLLIGLYGSRLGRATRQSAPGRRLLEHAYVAYKLLLEAKSIRHVAKLVQPDTWAIDVGANIGVFTLYFCDHTATAGIVAIEPEQANFRTLERRVAAAQPRAKVILRQAVAAEQAGTLNLAVNDLHPGDHQIAESGTPVAAVTLDGLVEECGHPPVSLVKIDVQGAELRVLQGATALLRTQQPALFVEVDEEALGRHGTSTVQLFEWLAGYGYAPHTLDRTGTPVPLAQSERPSGPGYTDILFIRPITP